MHTTEGTADVTFTSAGIAGLTMASQTVVLHGAPQTSDDPPPNVDPTGTLGFDLIVDGTPAPTPTRRHVEVDVDRVPRSAVRHVQLPGHVHLADQGPHPLRWVERVRVPQRLGHERRRDRRPPVAVRAADRPGDERLIGLIDDAISPIVGAATLGISNQVGPLLRDTIEGAIAAMVGNDRASAGAWPSPRSTCTARRR